MAGFLAAATQAPLTSFIIVMEMINGRSMVLSLMAAAMLASLIARLISRPLYSTLSGLMIQAVQKTDAPPERETLVADSAGAAPVEVPVATTAEELSGAAEATAEAASETPLANAPPDPTLPAKVADSPPDLFSSADEEEGPPRPANPPAV
jgi:hypothetical protein